MAVSTPDSSPPHIGGGLGPLQSEVKVNIVAMTQSEDVPLFFPQHGEHYRIELFEGDSFSGQCVELCEDCPFLRVKGLTKSCVNSIKVYGDGAYVSLQGEGLFGFLCVLD